MKFLLNFSFSVLFVLGFFANAEAQNRIRWMTWEEALAAHEKEPKKFVVDIYTKWCGWCKKMDKSTFQKDDIAKYVNNHFYAVKFNAETKEDIEFNGQTYKYVSKGRKGYHQLAVAITQGQLSYPTVVFLDEKLNLIQPIPGFQDAQMFEMIMTYFADDHYMSTPWNVYTRQYQSNKNVQTVGN